MLRQISILVQKYVTSPLHANRQAYYFHADLILAKHNLCQILNIRQYTQLSRIKEKLAPALDELLTHGYLAHWQLEETHSGNSYKIIFQHGEKFHRDQNQRLALRSQIPPQCESRKNFGSNDPLSGTPIDPELFNHLLRRGITEKMARHLLTHLAEDQQVLDQLEWGDHLLRNKRPNAFYNPTGLYIHLIRENVIPPDQFETSRQRQLREDACQGTKNTGTGAGQTGAGIWGVSETVGGPVYIPQLYLPGILCNGSKEKR